ncbi:MAG: choice-of-anchor J domain-containing protein, partial [Muribaculaceae bacterium]|nr:choice-of-anchor J domain-containing protein [Muribaculaceae bacterium]
YAFVYDEEGDSIALVAQSGYAWIYYAADGSVYMRDPVYGYKTNKWVKGTKDGNKITVPLGQYIIWTSDFQGLKTAWGEMGEEDFTYDTAGEVTYTIDDQTITLDGCEYSETSIKGSALVLDTAYVDKGWFGYLDLFTTYYVFPDAPENVTVNPAATTADVTWEPGTLTQWNLRYREHVEGAEYYSTGFETNDDLAGWHGWDADGDGKWWSTWTLTQGGMSGQCLTSASYDASGALTPDNWLVSPQVTLNGVVRFKAWGQDPDWCDEIIHVYLSNTTDSINAFTVDLSNDITVVALDTINPGYANNVYTFNIPDEYQGQQGYIAIRHYNVTDMFRVNVDDFYVGNPDVVVPEWIYVNGITEIPYTITGLDPETNYEVQLQSVNAGGTGDWGESTLFTTLAEVGYLRGDVDGSGTVDITDATTLINYLLNGSANPFVEDNADVDYSGGIDISDATVLINYLLTGNWPN